jgi:hypothetical protein
MATQPTILCFASLVVFILPLFLHMSLPNLNPALTYVASLVMTSLKKIVAAMTPLPRRLQISCHMEFWEHKMFNSQMHFPHSSSAYSPVFTDPSIILFLGSSADNSSSLDEPSTVASNFPDSTMDPLIASHTPEPTHEPRRSDRVKAPPAHLHDYLLLFSFFFLFFFSILATLHKPHSYCEANADPFWQKAMSDELDALSKTHKWDLIDLPPRKFTVGCKWVYKIKTRADGFVERYMVRLVAKGFAQEYGVDYEETFAPVARLTSIRSLLAVVVIRH